MIAIQVMTGILLAVVFLNYWEKLLASTLILAMVAIGVGVLWWLGAALGVI